VTKKRVKKSYIFYKFIENVDIDQTNLDIQRSQYSPNSLWRRRKSNMTVICQTIFYTCDASKECPCTLQLIINCTVNTGTVQISDDEHAHEGEKNEVKICLNFYVKIYVLKWEHLIIMSNFY